MGDNLGKTRVVIAFLSLIVLVLAVVLAIVTWKLYAKDTIEECNSHGLPIDTSPPDKLPPFHDLTKEEIVNVRAFLYKQSDLSLKSSVYEHSVGNSYIQLLELRIPEKEAVLAYLDEGAKQPVREAIVTIYRGSAPNPSVQEYIVGPTESPRYKKLLRQVSNTYRPISAVDFMIGLPAVEQYVHDTLGHIIEESYGGRLKNCTDKCMVMRTLTPYSSALSGEPTKRYAWLTLAADVEFFVLHQADMQFKIDMTSNDLNITMIYYSGQNYGSVQDLVDAYAANTAKKTKVPYPKVDKELFSTMHRRGKLFPDKPMQPPKLVNPGGNRYSIKGRHISYMGWDFDLRMSTFSGPQLYDIRYQNERIVYELSLQELSVFYSSHSPSHRVADFMDSLWLLGTLSRSLVSGVDCPDGATYLSSIYSFEYSDDPVEIPRAFCVFEHNTNMPLRRHLNGAFFNVHFFEGMMDTALVVRTIITVVNYDYIVDFMFHQNGAVHVKVASTGYIVGSLYAEADNDYGFRLAQNLLGNVHTHMFNFKVDIDINGRENVFEKLDLVPIEVDHSAYSATPGATYSQVKIERNKISTEQEAVKDFTTPCYYTFYNQNRTTKYGVPRAYRLHSKGSFKQILPRGKGNEPTISWARYPLAVTKYKESERQSTSLYGSWDSADPVVNFQSYIDNNDNITNVDVVAWVSMGLHHIPHTEDLPVTPTVGQELFNIFLNNHGIFSNSQDLVSWVSMGLHHIPHTEDLPVTPTVGQGLEFYLLPHNYFPEDPAMGSSDSVRIDQLDKDDLKKGLKITDYVPKDTGRCYRKAQYNYADLQANPGILFDPY